jgi:hypothetical protein
MENPLIRHDVDMTYLFCPKKIIAGTDTPSYGVRAATSGLSAPLWSIIDRSRETFRPLPPKGPVRDGFRGGGRVLKDFEVGRAARQDSQKKCLTPVH